MPSLVHSYRQERSAFWDIIDCFNREPQYWAIVGGIAAIAVLVLLGSLGVF